MPEGISVRNAFAGGTLTLILLVLLWVFVVYGLNETFGLVSYTIGWIISGHGLRLLEAGGFAGFRINGSTVWVVWLAFIFYKLYKYLFMKKSNELLSIVIFLLIFLPVSFVVWNFFGWALMDLAVERFGINEGATHSFQAKWDDNMYVFEATVIWVSIMLMTWEGMHLFWKYDMRPNRGYG